MIGLAFVKIAAAFVLGCSLVLTASVLHELATTRRVSTSDGTHLIWWNVVALLAFCLAILVLAVRELLS